MGKGIKIYTVYLALFIGASTMAFGGNGGEGRELPFIFNKFIAIGHGDISPTDVRDFNTEYLNTVALYKEKQQKWNNDFRLLYHVFYKTHHTYLKEYLPVESFGLMLKEGKYGCLTGTVLYALFLEELGYDYEVVETNYHVYIVINTDKQRFLFESTDPIYGFYDNEKEIAKKLKDASSDLKWKTKGSVDFSIQINNRLGLTELIGLQYYNMAVQSYNNGQMLSAISQLNEAANYYQSERLKVFLELILNEFNQEVQDAILEKHEYANLHKIAAL